MLSSICLAVEQPGTDQKIVDFLGAPWLTAAIPIDDPYRSCRLTRSGAADMLDLIFLIIFTFETVIKVICLGFYFGSAYAYLHNPWNILDFTIVLLGWFINIMPSGGESWLAAAIPMDKPCCSSKLTRVRSRRRRRRPRLVREHRPAAGPKRRHVGRLDRA